MDVFHEIRRDTKINISFIYICDYNPLIKSQQWKIYHFGAILNVENVLCLSWESPIVNNQLSYARTLVELVSNIRLLTLNVEVREKTAYSLLKNQLKFH